MARKYNRNLTANERAVLFGDELMRLTAAYIKNQTAQTLSDRDAALINRCASMAAAAVVPLYEHMEHTDERIEGMELQMADIWLKIDAMEAAHRAASE